MKKLSISTLENSFGGSWISGFCTAALFTFAFTANPFSGAATLACGAYGIWGGFPE